MPGFGAYKNLCLEQTARFRLDEVWLPWEQAVDLVMSKPVLFTGDRVMPNRFEACEIVASCSHQIARVADGSLMMMSRLHVVKDRYSQRS